MTRTTHKCYDGKRTADGTLVTVTELGGERRPLSPRLDLRNHSPTGFEWSYCGSGPAQLALAIAADLLGDDETAQDVYQELKRRVVAKLPHSRWHLTDQRLCQVIAEILSEQVAKEEQEA